MSEENNASSVISKVWGFASMLRDDGVGYGDYLEQLTYLLFLKMVDEYNRPPYSRNIPIPPEYNWESLKDKNGAELEVHYSELLRVLSTTKGTLGQIFTKSQNKIQDPAKLYKLIDMVDKQNWSMFGSDVKGKIYEGLLEKNAETLRLGNAETRKQMERGVFDIESVKKANQSLIDTINDSLRIADEGKAMRAKAEEEIKVMEGELREALIAAKAKADSPRQGA